MATPQSPSQDAGTVTPINVPYPDARDLHIRITEGACRLRIVPGEGEAWITGTYKDPSGMRPLHISQEGGMVRITEQQAASGLWGWLRAGHGFSQIPTLELALGKARPYWLTLEIGASENQLDLGGLPITRLSVKHGAGKTEIDFSAPNPQPMSLMEIGAGAGSTELRNLANAHFIEMLVEGGMAGYVLDFGGTLQQDAHARVSAALASVEISVPASTAARVSTESQLGNIEIGEGFTSKENAFWTRAAVEGRTPVLTASVNVTLGSLKLRML
ncbi:MAG: hypothetical protein ACXWQ5_16380 [Ktedonobacterales bacterium]